MLLQSHTFSLTVRLNMQIKDKDTRQQRLRYTRSNYITTIRLQGSREALHKFPDTYIHRAESAFLGSQNGLLLGKKKRFIYIEGGY